MRLRFRHLDAQEGKGITDPDDLVLVAKFKSNSYVAYVNLTLDVTNTQGLLPALNFMDFIGTFTGIAILGLSGIQHRNINPVFTLDLSRPDPKFANECAQENDLLFGIKGNLGIQEIILAGMRKSTPTDFGFGLISSLPGGENTARRGCLKSCCSSYLRFYRRFYDHRLFKRRPNMERLEDFQGTRWREQRPCKRAAIREGYPLDLVCGCQSKCHCPTTASSYRRD